MTKNNNHVFGFCDQFECFIILPLLAQVVCLTRVNNVHQDAKCPDFYQRPPQVISHALI